MIDESIFLKRELEELEKSSELFDIEFEKYKIQKSAEQIYRLGKLIEGESATFTTDLLRIALKHLKDFVTIVESSQEYRNEQRKEFEKDDQELEKLPVDENKKPISVREFMKRKDV